MHDLLFWLTNPKVRWTKLYPYDCVTKVTLMLLTLKVKKVYYEALIHKLIISSINYFGVWVTTSFYNKHGCPNWSFNDVSL